jgi:hypothetical protein
VIAQPDEIVEQLLIVLKANRIHDRGYPFRLGLPMHYATITAFTAKTATESSARGNYTCSSFERSMPENLLHAACRACCLPLGMQTRALVAPAGYAPGAAAVRKLAAQLDPLQRLPASAAVPSFGFALPSATFSFPVPMGGERHSTKVEVLSFKRNGGKRRNR